MASKWNANRCCTTKQFDADYIIGTAADVVAKINDHVVFGRVY
jgi:hypothetical protein